MLKPLNDYFLIEVIPEQWAGGNQAEEGIRKGKVVDISDFVSYWGSHTYYFDSSANNDKMLADVQNKYRKLIGKVVYWPERSESGTVVSYGDKEYLFMKWASLMGMEAD